jgi:hypothetical protein
MLILSRKLTKDNGQMSLLLEYELLGQNICAKQVTNFCDLAFVF